MFITNPLKQMFKGVNPFKIFKLNLKNSKHLITFLTFYANLVSAVSLAAFYSLLNEFSLPVCIIGVALLMLSFTLLLTNQLLRIITFYLIFTIFVVLIFLVTPSYMEFFSFVGYYMASN